MFLSSLLQCLIPLMVASKISKYETHEANNLFVVSAENFAKQAVRLIGKTHITTGCWQHDIQVQFRNIIEETERLSKLKQKSRKTSGKAYVHILNVLLKYESIQHSILRKL